MSDEIKRIDIAEFRRLGYLQEANRQFFHPHGLALEVSAVDEGGWKLDGDQVGQMADTLEATGLLDRVDEDDLVGQQVRLEKAKRFLDEMWPEGAEYLSGVWDYRDDPEGMYYGDEVDLAKAQAVDREWNAKLRTRTDALGYMVQPAGDGS